MNIILHDNDLHLRFAPLTLTRPVGDLRVGILTNKERWEKWIPEATVSFQTEKYISKKFPRIDGKADVEVNAAIIPTEAIAAAVVHLEDNQVLVSENTWIARRGNATEKIKWTEQHPLELTQRWDLFQKNDEILVADYFLLTGGRETQYISTSNTVIGDPSLIFLEVGASVEGSFLNTTSGPIYIAKDAEIMEGSMIRGPFSLGEHAVVKMGSKIYGATTIGPFCKVGGEISNCVFQSYSNKGHDGFLGNSMVGEWCNFGADSNTSNLKNNYSMIRSWSFEEGAEVETGLQFMGVCMGDHSKCAINTMFNTASVVGVSCNIFGGNFPKKFIPSFSWGAVDGTELFELKKAKEAANAMMNRRGLELTEGDVYIFDYLAKIGG
ncbi:putative sugar nucleotidyl transferase [Fluviicola taffensis]|uniref:Sugar phosphate nucleotidyl transferase n=1 Tax=Fluviicola taffensis (strain DSM 16823 / NCIMB 13979 / RW262) TaxID=755732 RepID=F2IDI6_FLUTR|nr:putative sugar nucleotidyl transferase [Fluviicola taffensis]AEA42362.1 sugar phosphate nucleotidyl transferase [Fluviicola taffensis DSM 16823]